MKKQLSKNSLVVFCTATIIAASLYFSINNVLAQHPWNSPTGSPPPLTTGETAPRGGDTPGVDMRSNPHAAFKDNTNACAQCHSTHLGKAANLLRESTRKDLCFTCHDGRGSKYDSKNGLYFSSAGTIVDSLAGGFNESGGFTSTHMIEANNVAPGGTSDQIMLVCTTCHNPHGTGNFRNLATVINGVTLGNHSITTPNSIDGIYVADKLDSSTNTYEPDIRESSYTKAEVVSYGGGFDKFCSSCHQDYLYYHYEGTNMEDPTKYRHPVGTLLTGGSRTTTADAQEMPLSYTYPTSLFTTLPTQGVPSGVYPLPTSFVDNVTSTLVKNKYWYLVTAKNMLGESHQGYIKGIEVDPAVSKRRVVLEFPTITNALTYRVYRATTASGTATAPTDLNQYTLISDDNITTDFTYDPATKKIRFTDAGRSQVSTEKPPEINKQAPVNASGIGVNAPKIMCLTCHFSHGTKTHDYFTGESKLKRQNSMGVCQDCHKK